MSTDTLYPTCDEVNAVVSMKTPPPSPSSPTAPSPLPPPPPPPTYGILAEPITTKTAALDCSGNIESANDDCNSSSSSDDDGDDNKGNGKTKPAEVTTFTTAYGDHYDDGSGSGSGSGSESDSDSESDSENGADNKTTWQRLSSKVRRQCRRASRKAIKLSRKAKKQTKTTLTAAYNWAMQPDEYIKALYVNKGMGVKALLNNGYSLEQIRNGLGFTKIKHLCTDPQGGLTVDVMGSAMWDSLILNFGMRQKHLSKYFGLTTFHGFLDAQLRGGHLAALDFNASILCKNNQLSKANLIEAAHRGWLLKDWVALALNYDTLLALKMQRGDYLTQMGIPPHSIAKYLRLFESNDVETVATRERIGLFYTPNVRIIIHP